MCIFIYTSGIISCGCGMVSMNCDENNAVYWKSIISCTAISWGCSLYGAYGLCYALLKNPVTSLVAWLFW